ncbi:hypothetical protein JRO89_XS04G0278400 [Xanthoceras sorbifolium]|uniref:Protein YIP n=1 Tax=Xanthoceras sorbifolium TaxID=99658 RepID=A0ABQ8I7R4_9ROSI|nr:hypothetical protein JRO89_XS04G0278400 [Xanthoceras sorbifolium]
MSHSDTIPLHPSSQSDIDEIENLINASVQAGPATVLPARPPSPTRPATIPVSSSPFMQSNLPAPPPSSTQKVPSVPAPPPPLPPSTNSGGSRPNIGTSGFGPAPNTLTEPVWDTVKRDLSRIVSNLKLVVFPNPFREDPGKALRDWDLWGPFFFIVFLGLTLSWSASVKKLDWTGQLVINDQMGHPIGVILVSFLVCGCQTAAKEARLSMQEKVLFGAHSLVVCLGQEGEYVGLRILDQASSYFAAKVKVDMAFPLMTYLNQVGVCSILCVCSQGISLDSLLSHKYGISETRYGYVLHLSYEGGHIIFFQSLSLLGYCLFPLDIGALICMLKNNVIVKVIVVCVTLAWSSWAAYPFMSSAVNPRRKALALYPVFLMYVSVGFLIIAID